MESHLQASAVLWACEKVKLACAPFMLPTIAHRGQALTFKKESPLHGSLGGTVVVAYML